jgi:hypothetical protein
MERAVMSNLQSLASNHLAISIECQTAGRNVMKLNAVRRSYLLFAVALVGCAAASVSQQSQSVPINNTRPAQIVIYPFAVDTTDVTLNQSIVQRAYRTVSNQDQSAEQKKIAHETAHNICVKVAATLSQNGYQAVCQERGIPVVESNVVVVDGQFTNISEGNRLRRLVIGLGAGASALDSHVDVFQKTAQGTRQILDFTTHADSGKMPGAAVMGPAGAAAGGSAAAVVGTNAAMGGAKTYASSTAFLADKTADQIVQTLTQYYAQQGWAS